MLRLEEEKGLVNADTDADGIKAAASHVAAAALVRRLNPRMLLLAVSHGCGRQRMRQRAHRRNHQSLWTKC